MVLIIIVYFCAPWTGLWAFIWGEEDKDKDEAEEDDEDEDEEEECEVSHWPATSCTHAAPAAKAGQGAR